MGNPGLKSVKLLVTFNVIIAYIFLKDFIEIYQSLSEYMNYYFFSFHQFFGFIYFYMLQKTNDISIYKIVSAVFLIGLFCIGCLRIALRYNINGLVLLPI